ncbi:MAG: virulence protein RhuM/Fic/DOC family protein [Bifidobacteriaceae bacterium]|jgi:prophage maintenance system killer protein|nr:virulence protein RhuM/Fic/DOC family protein [Bifidobacteriaceae bacterium]
MSDVNTGADPSGIVIYQSEDGSTAIDVRLERDTVWLTQEQLAALFQRDQSVISRHVANAKREGEILPGSFMQNVHRTSPGRPGTLYDLEVVIAVGYRVKSTEGVRFRRWATTVLRDHLTRGYTVNQRRLDQLHLALEIVARSAAPEIAGVTSVLQVYAEGLTLLDDYDHQRLPKPPGTRGSWELTYGEARAFVDSMRQGQDSALFGAERDGSFSSSVATIYQGFDGREFYPSVQEKAANRLYLVVKNHSFVDGNKRIAAALFAYFLERNGVLRELDGAPVIDNAALAGLTLMIALSQPAEKDAMCNLVMNCLAPAARAAAGEAGSGAAAGRAASGKAGARDGGEAGTGADGIGQQKARPPA